MQLVARRDPLPDGWACTVWQLPSGARLQVDEKDRCQRVFVVAPKMALNPKYVPRGLSKADAAAQRRSIERGEDRPQVDYPYRRSKWVRKYEQEHGEPITNLSYIDRHLMTRAGARKVLDKGRGAYYSAGSRPNTTAEQWAYARLASVLVGGPARKVDKDIWERFRR